MIVAFVGAAAWVLPLPRRYDDQFTRAARWRAIAGSDATQPSR